jgi:GR25 family glycosyltransferase involved in LPS biosynthesis
MLVDMELTFNGIKIADAGFVINLPERIDRRVDVDNLLSSLGFKGYIFFNGVKEQNNNWKQFGCTQAYINLFEIILKEGIDNVLIFEDDIKLMNSTSYNEIDAIFKKWHFFSKKYDVIALGTRPLPGFKIIKEDINYGKLTNMLTTHCFFYRKNFIEYLFVNLQNFKNKKSIHYKCIIDEFINDCCSHNFILKNKNKLFDIGITIPMVFTQKDSYSNNEDNYQDYDKWMEDCFWDALS